MKNEWRKMKLQVSNIQRKKSPGYFSNQKCTQGFIVITFGKTW
jgi:hypothetical protein